MAATSLRMPLSMTTTAQFFSGLLLTTLLNICMEYILSVTYAPPLYCGVSATYSVVFVVCGGKRMAFSCRIAAGNTRHGAIEISYAVFCLKKKNLTLQTW